MSCSYYAFDPAFLLVADCNTTDALTESDLGLFPLTGARYVDEASRWIPFKQFCEKALWTHGEVYLRINLLFPLDVATAR